MRHVLARARDASIGALLELVRWVASALVVFGTFAILLTPGSHPLSHHADDARLRLDAELQRAEQSLGIPPDFFATVIDQEDQTTASADTWNSDDNSAAATYRVLLQQVHTIESTHSDALQVKTLTDLTDFQGAVADARTRGFGEVSPYQARLEQAMSAYDKATSVADFGQLDSFIVAQIEALQLLGPTYQQLQDFGNLLESLRLFGMPSLLGETAYAQDEQAFRDLTPQRIATLQRMIGGQTQQVEDDDALALPLAGTGWLRQMQQRVAALRGSGDARNAVILRQMHDEDAHLLASASTPADYVILSQQMEQQADTMSLPLLRLQVHSDLDGLRILIGRAQQQWIVDPFTGRRYPAAYEYADAARGYGALQREALAAHSMDALHAVHHEINVMYTNLQAMLQNLHDAAPHNQPHQADQQLLRLYGLTQGKVIIVSLREQTTRLYDNGKLVYWAYTTTGMLERPTPPGLYYAMSKSSPLLFTTSESSDSPFWFAPTPVNYAIAYLPGGYFLHDAPWRHEFGPGTNLPHYDPAAFNGGSHGCINYTEARMRWIYDWTVVGTPVIAY